jgi:hypothetical protein
LGGNVHRVHRGALSTAWYGLPLAAAIRNCQRPRRSR